METIILFVPLVGALLCGFGWKFIGENGGAVGGDIAPVPVCVALMGRVLRL